MNSDRTYKIIRAVRAAVLYFAIVFAAGFVLGTIRLLFVIPLVGVRAAELIEMPVMIAISFLTASWLIAKLKIPFAIGARLAIGLVALALLLFAEVILIVWLQHQGLVENIKNRDPISGIAYSISLLLFAAFPLIVRRRSNANILRN